MYSLAKSEIWFLSWSRICVKSEGLGWWRPKAGSEPGNKDRAMTCSWLWGVRAVGRHWIGREYFRTKIWLRKALRQCSCLWTHDLDKTGTYQLSFTYCLEPWPSVPCWLWLEAWPRGTQQFSCCFSDALVQSQWFLLVQALTLHSVSAQPQKPLPAARLNEMAADVAAEPTI